MENQGETHWTMMENWWFNGSITQYWGFLLVFEKKTIAGLKHLWFAWRWKAKMTIFTHINIWKFHVRDESMTVNDSERRWYKKQKNAINTNLQFILAGAKHSQCLLKACLQAGDDAVLRLGSWMRKHLRIPALICSCLCSWHHAMMPGDDTMSFLSMLTIPLQIKYSMRKSSSKRPHYPVLHYGPMMPSDPLCRLQLSGARPHRHVSTQAVCVLFKVIAQGHICDAGVTRAVSHATSILWGLSICLKTRYPQWLATKWATPTIIGQPHLAWLSKSSRKVSNLSSGIKPTVQWPNAKSCKSSSALSWRNDHHGPAATNWLLTDLSQNVALPTVRNVIGVNEALMGVNMF